MQEHIMRSESEELFFVFDRESISNDMMKEGTNHISFEQDTKRLTAQNEYEIDNIFV